MKRSARTYFQASLQKNKISGTSKQAITFRNNFISILSDEALYFSIGKTSMICVLILINSFFLPINNLYWLFTIGSASGPLLCSILG